MNSLDTIGECKIEQWDEELKAEPVGFQNTATGKFFALGSVLPCPVCETVGFYAARRYPREGAPIRKYRACKYCGFWQEVWGNGYNDRGSIAEFYLHLRCTNEQCMEYGWTRDNRNKSCDVEICKSRTEVVDTPFKDPKHPYRMLKDLVKENR